MELLKSCQEDTQFQENAGQQGESESDAPHANWFHQLKLSIFYFEGWNTGGQIQLPEILRL